MDLYAPFCSVLLLVTAVNGYEPPPQWCYRCVSSQPGCGDDFNWLWNWSARCPELGDKCVKIVERKGGDTFYTRDCLSAIRAGFRTDIPADQYEGCRYAAVDPHLGNYVNNSMKELDIYRNHYSSTEFCFCFFKNRCNGAASVIASPFVFLALAAIAAWRYF